MKELVLILDKSGSMAGKELDTIGSFNRTISKRKNDNWLVTTVVFSDRSSIIHDRLPIKEIGNMTEDDYCVGGSTALIDAIGKMIDHISSIHHYARKEDVPERTLFVIMTDGEENASHLYTSDEVKRMIQNKKETDWDFIFLGGDIDSVETSKKLGISEKTTVNYHNDKKGIGNAYGILEKIMDFISEDECYDVEECCEWRQEADEDYSSR